MLRTARCGVRAPVGFLFSETSRPATGPIQPPTKWVWVSFQEIKRPGPEDNYSLRSRAEVKNEWSYTFAFSIRLHVLDRGDLYFQLPVVLESVNVECVTTFLRLLVASLTCRYQNSRAHLAATLPGWGCKMFVGM
jgi:hypothetical protein